MIRTTSALMSILFGALTVAGCGLGAQLPAPGTRDAVEVAAAAKKGDRYKIAQTFKSQHWAKLERVSSTYDRFPVERARPNGRHTDPEIVAAFGTETPSSRDVVLHYAAGWNQGEGTPILLVHGSILDATSEWIAPHGKEGLVKTLTEKGHRVFAVTFAHRHGDNLLWAEQIANAIARIKDVTGAKQVDVVAHSKGTVAARAYASGVKASWGQAYRGDIRKLVLLGGPHLGIDFAFRHASVNLGLYPEKKETLFNAPMTWTKMLAFGVWTDTSEYTLMRSHGDYFPGQAQMLYRWDKTYALPKLEQDWYTTYHGGQGFISVSPGIDKAIAEGGHFIDKLRANPLDKRIALASLAGDQATMKNILNEKTGPSDGVVFVKSATHTDDMTKGGAKLLANDTMPVNHMELVYAPKAKAWIVEQLQKP
ncbi:Alpha/beta hydrolase family protein [compost metagenome]